MQGTYLIYPEKDVFGISRKIRLLMNRSMWLFLQNHQRGIIYDPELFIWCSIYMSYQIFQDMWVPRYLKCLVKLPQPYWTLILQVSYALLYFLSFPLTLLFQLTRLFWRKVRGIGWSIKTGKVARFGGEYVFSLGVF